MPRDSQTRLTMSVMREMLLLAEQMKLWVVRRAVCVSLTDETLRRAVLNSRDEAFPRILVQHPYSLKSLSFCFDLLFEVCIFGRPFGIQRRQRSVELKVALQQWKGRVGLEVGGVGAVGRYRWVEGAVVDPLRCERRGEVSDLRRRDYFTRRLTRTVEGGDSPSCLSTTVRSPHPNAHSSPCTCS